MVNWDYGAYWVYMVDIHNSCMQSRSIVVLYEEVPDSWIRKGFQS